eukprot:182955_1
MDDRLLTNEILLNVSNFFEIFSKLNSNLFCTVPLSPEEWMNELSSNSMSPNLNAILLDLIQKCGIQSRDDIKTPLSNEDLIQLLFNECIVREHKFILHCKIDIQFMELMKSNYCINKINSNNKNKNKKK